MYAVRYIQLNINAPSFIFHPHLRLQSKEKRLGRGLLPPNKKLAQRVKEPNRDLARRSTAST